MDVGKKLDTIGEFVANIENYGFINEEEAEKLLQFYTDKLVAETVDRLEKGETNISEVITDILK